MKRLTLLWLAALAIVSTPGYPPAPHHTFYGMVRDQYGTPIQAVNAEVILETASGVKLSAKIAADGDPGVNYEIEVPMDAGITSDLYVATAMRPTVPFKIKVKIGTVTYLPIEMIGDYSHIGQPGGKTHLNLTLGEDSDGDGLPDAWERALLNMSGSNGGLSDITPDQDSDHDGLSNLEEYLAGTYAFDSKNGFSLEAAGFSNGHANLRFMAIRGRTYTILGSADLKEWVPIQFKIPALAETIIPSYYAADTRIIQVESSVDPAHPVVFYRLMAQ